MRLSLLALAFAAACSSPNGNGAQPSPQPTHPAAKDAAAVTDAAPALAELPCGGSLCGPDEFCEERYKGHAADEQGRPLEKKRCTKLPAACRTSPSCACLKQHLSFKHCRETNGRVHTDDYPR